MSDIINPVSSFQTPDGQLFPTREAAMAHLSRDKFRERAMRFAKSRSWSRGQEARAVNLVTDFLSFEEGGQGVTQVA